MPNRYDESLRVELRQRLLRLYKTSAEDLQKHLSYFRDWVSRQPTLELLLSAIDASDPDFDPDAWVTEQLTARRGDYELPDSEVSLARVGWRIVTALAAEEMTTSEILAFSRKSNYNDAATEVVGGLIEPMFDYIESRLSSGDELLHVLKRYRDRVAWFERESLLKQYRSDTGHGEARLDADLRRFIFDQGYDFPFAQPRGPSGDVDILADLGGDPLPCEVKLFDGKTKGVSRLATGITQALRYAGDYGRVDGYLVIYNLGDRTLELPTDDPERRWPPRLDIAGISVFLIVIDLGERPSASQEGRPAPQKVSRSKLIEKS